MTTQVATVRQSASVPVNYQIARIDATTAMRMHVVVIQNENDTTRVGLRKARLFTDLRLPRSILQHRVHPLAGQPGLAVEE